MDKDRSCCIRDYCGKPFSMSEKEPRDGRLLKAFWPLYCPEHRLADEPQEPIVNIPKEQNGSQD